LAREFDFSPSVIRTISERAGYRCSFGGCDRILIGPGEGTTGVSRLGEVGHIYSGSQYGPRYDESISSEELVSPQNGVLLCRQHHRLVDCLESTYSAADIVNMKDRHEKRIAFAMEDTKSSFVWIDTLEIDRFQVFEEHSVIKFGQVNHIYGPMGSGKTAILELLNSILSSSRSQRWRKLEPILSISFNRTFGPQTVVKTVLKSGVPQYRVGDKNELTFPEPYFVVFLQNAIANHADDLTAISNCYGIPVPLFERLVENADQIGITTKVTGLSTTRQVPYLARDLMVNVGNNLDQSFQSCSGSEQSRVVLDMGISLASQLSRHRPVLLLIDWVNLGSLDIENFVPYIDYLFSSKAHFQSVFVSPDPIPKLPWNGWQKMQRTYRSCQDECGAYKCLNTGFHVCLLYYGTLVSSYFTHIWFFNSLLP
jgi:hypothetical protein